MIHDLLVELAPERLVVKVGTVTGWVQDLAATLEIHVQVTNPSTEGWRWRRVKRKTDRDDALKIPRLSAANQLPTVWMPCRRVRQWRSLIHYRHELVGLRTAIRNIIRSTLDAPGYRMPLGAAAWTEAGLKRLGEWAQAIEACPPEQLWRGQLPTELTLLAGT